MGELPGVPTVLAAIERYYDTVPRRRAAVESIGPFTLFVGEPGGWPYYARPSIVPGEAVEAHHVAAVVRRQHELGVPLAIEWVDDVTPQLLVVVRAEGTLATVSRAPLLIHDGGRLDDPIVPECSVRLLEPDDVSVLARVDAVQLLAFGPDRDPPTDLDALDAASREPSTRSIDDLATGAVRTAVAEHHVDGVVAVGRHVPIDHITELVGIAVLPSFQRRGIGAAVTRALVNDAVELGVSTVFLTAGSERVADLYRRLGFVDLATAYVAGR